VIYKIWKYKNFFLLSVGLHVCIMVIFAWHFHARSNQLRHFDASLHQRVAAQIIYANLITWPMQSQIFLRKNAAKAVNKTGINFTKAASEQKRTHHDVQQTPSPPTDSPPVVAKTGKDASEEFARLIHDLIQSRLHYPRILDEIQANIPARAVTLGFVLHPSGIIENVEVLKSSGIKILDQEAQTTVAALLPQQLQFAHIFLHAKQYLIVNIVFGKT
jgi:TonB family protein